MTAKEELREIYFKDKEILNLQDQIEETRCKLEKVTPVLSDMPTARGGSQDKITDGVARLIELKEKLNAKVDAICDYRLKCLEKIDKIPDGRYRVVLKERYFNNKKFEEISLSMNYAYGFVLTLHGEALKEYGKTS